MTAFALIFTLAAIGISETAYLVRTRRAEQHPACPIGGGCTTVLTSRYRRLFLVSNDTLGLAAYGAIAVLAALVVIGTPPAALWWRLLTIFIGIGALVSVFFTYLQAYVIRAWCFWCVMSALTMWLMALIVLFHNVAPYA